MMIKKLILLVPMVFLLCYCNKTEPLNENYKPGFGEFMLDIQIHHGKLWFAGKNENWPLANFEIDEILETVGNIQKFEKERKETQVLPIIIPMLDGLKNAVREKNTQLFEKRFVSLTNTCNTCHRDVKFEFNIIKIPETPPFTNQDFAPTKK